MTTLGKSLATLACIIAAIAVFALGFLANGYIERGKMLESYNGANQMRADAKADTERADAKEKSLVQILQGLGEAETQGALPEPTPGPLDARGMGL